MRTSLFTVCWLIVAFGAAVAATAAMPGPGTLNGVVLNSKGVPVPRAEVFWQSADGRAPHALKTDEEGQFHLGALREGLYDLRAEAGGSWSEWEHNVVVRPGHKANVTLRLVRKTLPTHPSAAQK